jgi:hypothetical protein
METNKMVALSPVASSLLALVAENPAISEDRITQLMANVDGGLREIVSQAISVIRRSSDGSTPANAPGDPTASVAQQIADAYLRWARENSVDTSRNDHRKTAAAV